MVIRLRSLLLWPYEEALPIIVSFKHPETSYPKLVDRSPGFTSGTVVSVTSESGALLSTMQLDEDFVFTTRKNAKGTAGGRPHEYVCSLAAIILLPKSLDGNIATRKTNLKHLPSLQDFNLVSVAEDAESGIPPIVGRLGQSLEGGTKRRIFTIGNDINHMLLSPIHDWLIRVLTRIPKMGLSSRTAQSFVSSIVSSALAYNIFEVPCPIFGLFCRWTASQIFFLWATLYLITPCPGVVLCRISVPRPRLCFEKYGVLGSDVVIANQKVDEVYEQSLKGLEVDIFIRNPSSLLLVSQNLLSALG
ncbi:hypothetical protein M9H77_12008 [Catharanthus roseus]|uniref:Uncharacterized protein n=1 Tax=Catharanthus roseus TaxID=4058 RepID=A0ACC0BG39_CATRO|nr:hypothetical protein M9H77_12008 [Catharanthus roseus]